MYPSVVQGYNIKTEPHVSFRSLFWILWLVVKKSENICDRNCNVVQILAFGYALRGPGRVTLVKNIDQANVWYILLVFRKSRGRTFTQAKSSSVTWYETVRAQETKRIRLGSNRPFVEKNVTDFKSTKMTQK